MWLLVVYHISRFISKFFLLDALPEGRCVTSQGGHSRYLCFFVCVAWPPAAPVVPALCSPTALTQTLTLARKLSAKITEIDIYILKKKKWLECVCVPRSMVDVLMCGRKCLDHLACHGRLTTHLHHCLKSPHHTIASLQLTTQLIHLFFTTHHTTSKHHTVRH